MLVYRLEDIKEQGPGSNHKVNLTAYGLFWSLDHHVPIDEEVTGFHYGMKVACKSLKDLSHWFPCTVRVKEMMIKHGFKIAVYQVPESKIKQGKFQLAFHPDNSTFIKHLSMSQYKDTLSEERGNKNKLKRTGITTRKTLKFYYKTKKD